MGFGFIVFSRIVLVVEEVCKKSLFSSFTKNNRASTRQNDTATAAFYRFHIRDRVIVQWCLSAEVKRR